MDKSGEFIVRMNGQVHIGDNLMSLTGNLETFHAVYVQARIDHPALVTGFHGTRPELHSTFINDIRLKQKCPTGS